MDYRSLLRLDAAFEALLSAVLIAGGAASWLTGSDLPHPVGRGGAIAAGVALAVFAVALVALAHAGAGRAVLLTLALVNAVTGVAALVWLVAARGFSPATAALMAVAVAGLLALGALQLRAAARRSPPIVASEAGI